MKIAILGDIHANIEALEAVLADLDTVGPDKVYCTGDVIGYGANPRECLGAVREREWPVVVGNWEQVVGGTGNTQPEQFNPYAAASAYWTLGAMTREEKQFLAGLPESVCDEGIQIVHGSTGEDKPCRYVLSLEDAKEALEAAMATVAFLGHTHVPTAYLGGDTVDTVIETHDETLKLADGATAVVNTGAVGQPRDGDVRACYCLYDTEAREVVRRRVEYDVDKAAAKIVDGGLPQVLGQRLTVGK